MQTLENYETELEEKVLMLETIRDQRDKMLSDTYKRVFEYDVTIRNLKKDIRDIKDIIKNRIYHY